MLLAGQTEPAPDPFLLIWGLAVIAVGDLCNEEGATRMHSFIVNGLEQIPRQQAKTRAMPGGFLRCIGGSWPSAEGWRCPLCWS